MSCGPPNESVGGVCYLPCPPNFQTYPKNKAQCIQTCPSGFMEAEGSCIRPTVPRDRKPTLDCPPGATRIAEQCYLPCPNGTHAEFEICVPDCPPGFVETSEGTICEAEFIKRSSNARPACFPGETRVNNLCLSACPANMIPFPDDVSLCQYVVPEGVQQYFSTIGFVSAKIITGRPRIDATCQKDFVPASEGCFGLCPLNSDANNDSCVVRCPAGFVQTASSCARQIINRAQAPTFGSQVLNVFHIILTGFVIFVVATFVIGRFRRS